MPKRRRKGLSVMETMAALLLLLLAWFIEHPWISWSLMGFASVLVLIGAWRKLHTDRRITSSLGTSPANDSNRATHAPSPNEAQELGVCVKEGALTDHDSLLWPVTPRWGHVTAEPSQVGIVMRNGSLHSRWHGGRKAVPVTGEIRTYLVSTRPFDIRFSVSDATPGPQSAQAMLEGTTSDHSPIHGSVEVRLQVNEEVADWLLNIGGQVTTTDVARHIRLDVATAVAAVGSEHAASEFRGYSQDISESISEELEKALKRHGLGVVRLYANLSAGTPTLDSGPTNTKTVSTDSPPQPTVPNTERAWIVRGKAGGKYWVVDQFVDKEVVSIGWPAMGDLSRFSAKGELRSALKRFHPESGDGTVNILWGFCREICVGDVIVTPAPNPLSAKPRTKPSQIVIWRCIGPYEYNPGVIECSKYPFASIRKVERVAIVSVSRLSQKLQDRLQLPPTVSPIKQQEYVQELESAIKS